MEMQSLEVLSEKVEKALLLIRSLKSEKATLVNQVEYLRKELDDRDGKMQYLRMALQEREGKIHAATARLEAVMNSLEAELGETTGNNEVEGEIEEQSAFSVGNPQSFLDFGESK